MEKNNKRTIIDIELSRAYFSILIDLAREKAGEKITYGSLVSKSKERFPQNQIIAKAIATNAGRRLDTLREFTNSLGVPDLSSLVINKSTGTNGSGFTKSFDGDAIRQAVLQFDWSSVQIKFDAFIEAEKEAVIARSVASLKPKKLTESAALMLYWEYYKEDKSRMKGMGQKEKDKVIHLMMDNMPIEQAMSLVFPGKKLHK